MFGFGGTLHVLRPAEVIPVLRFAQPAALPRRLGRRPAGALRAVLLPPAIAHIDGENLPAAQALALYFVGPWVPRRADPFSPIGGQPPPNPQPSHRQGENRRRIKRLINLVRRIWTNITPTFKPPESNGSQIAADNWKVGER
jgi:hypothetical protein